MSELRADGILLGTNWSGVSAQVHGEPKDLDKKAALALRLIALMDHPRALPIVPSLDRAMIYYTYAEVCPQGPRRTCTPCTCTHVLPSHVRGTHAQVFRKADDAAKALAQYRLATAEARRTKGNCDPLSLMMIPEMLNRLAVRGQRQSHA